MRTFVIWLIIFICVPIHAWAETPNGLVYHMLVRSFADGKSDPQGNGDLQGVIDKLDYLNDDNPATDNDLEVQVLWLMPVFPFDCRFHFLFMSIHKLHRHWSHLSIQ